ncbi:hypothetical protein GMDG_05224 [Pseudogymnoascus destructans 20631-21]|uniref:Uncharacterized protein n=1 Tax=Pseudogymnoascus destructans (strain ATCC MYA-4855 / 20631-21) TaxID=658429 RepID=L8FNM7_PSED2|nr:hypothetical protein GMDG_05224 [Pseudogymnoascus destructans 20631-21]
MDTVSRYLLCPRFAPACAPPNLCGNIPKFAIRRFNRLMRAHGRFLFAWERTPMSNRLVRARSKILEERQANYTAWVTRGKNVIWRGHVVGADSKPVKINQGLALLEICDTLHGIQRTLRHSNDLVKALVRLPSAFLPTTVTPDLELALGGGAAEDEDTLLDDDDKVVELAAGEAYGAM